MFIALHRPDDRRPATDDSPTRPQTGVLYVRVHCRSRYEACAISVRLLSSARILSRTGWGVCSSRSDAVDARDGGLVGECVLGLFGEETGGDQQAILMGDGEFEATSELGDRLAGRGTLPVSNRLTVL